MFPFDCAELAMEAIVPIAEDFIQNIPSYFSHVQNLVLNYNYTGLYESTVDVDIEKNAITQTLTFGPVFPFFFICNILYVSCNQRRILQTQVT